MSGGLRPLALREALGRLVDRTVLLLTVVAIGAVLGLQYVAPNKRVLPVLAALVMFAMTWRLDMVSGLGVLVLALPFPRALVFGSTTLAFVLLLLIIWMLRVSSGQSLPPRRSPLDAPLLALFVCYVVSFYNIEPENFGTNLVIFEMMVATWLMLYLFVNNLRRRAHLEQIFGFQAVSILLICLVAVFEITHPGQPLVPGWIMFHEGQSNLVSFRVGSVFHDFELLCEFCALNLLLVVFLLVRARSLLLRTVYGVLLVFVIFVMFTTVTRGGLISLGAGIVYLVWMMRRRLQVVPLTIAAVSAVALFIGMNTFVAEFTPTGNLFERMAGTEMRGGFMPENRAAVWPMGWNRIFEHPLIGHGPYYTTMRGTQEYAWPHSLYLFVANNVGFIGLAAFLWLLVTLFRITRPPTDDLRHPDVAQAYMLIARAQLVVFVLDEAKIEYLRYDIYEFQVWLVFALMVAAFQIHTHPSEDGAAARPRLAGLRLRRTP